MLSEQRDAYLSWLRERGLRYPVRRLASLAAASPAAAPAISAAASPAIVAFISAAPLTCEERALLDKMIAAMKLPADSVLVADGAHWREHGSLRMAILLGNYMTPTNCETLVIHHPGDLLRDPSKKRETWSALQAAMMTLGLA